MKPLLLCCVAVAGCATTPLPAAPVEAPPPPPPPPEWTRTAPPAQGLPVALEEPRVREVMLPNGLRVVTVEHHRRPLVSIRLFFKEGAGGEVDKAAGSTAIAVALLGDTFDDPQNEVFNEKSVRMQVAEAGGRFAADVTLDHAWIGIDGYAADAGRYLAMLKKIVARPRCSGELFWARVEGMLAALEDEAQLADGAYAGAIVRRAFGSEGIYARSVLGSERSLRKLDYPDVAARQRQIVHPVGATLLIVGDVNPDQVLKRAQAVFGSWRRRAVVGASGVKLASSSKRAQVGARTVTLIPRAASATTTVCAARPLAPNEGTDGERRILARVLEQRLTRLLREEHGLTYHASSSVIVRRHASALVACSALSVSRLSEGLRLFSQTVSGLRTAPPEESEIELAKATLTSDLRSRTEDLQSVVRGWTFALELGKRTASSVSEHEGIERVTASDVGAFARRLVGDRGFGWILSGEPTKVTPAVRRADLGWTVVVEKP